MSYTMHIDHTRVNYSHGNAGRKYIVIHYTGNPTDSAAGNANYFRSVNRGASAHYFVDTANVYEVVNPDNSAWAVGVNYGRNNLFGKCTNWNSVNIEMCSVNGRIPQATIDNTVTLTKSLMAKYGIPASHVVRHWDVCSKRCPGWAGWIPGDEHIWNAFKSALTAAPAKPRPRTIIRPEAYGVFRFYSGNDHMYTADIKEAQKLADAGWKYEGIAWHWTGSVPAYRLYDGSQHLFTADQHEASTLITRGWKNESASAFGCERERKDGTVPVYRLENKNTGEHVLTVSAKERNTLVKAGWILEGVAFYEHK